MEFSIFRDAGLISKRNRLMSAELKRWSENPGSCFDLETERSIDKRGQLIAQLKNPDLQCLPVGIIYFLAKFDRP